MTEKQRTDATLPLERGFRPATNEGGICGQDAALTEPRRPRSSLVAITRVDEVVFLGRGIRAEGLSSG